MRCPSLKELPPTPKSKTGWPWDLDSVSAYEEMRNGGKWPRISIVCTSYNHEEFLEETIRSVLLQGYPNLEFIIIDDGSVDNSINIIKDYNKWISYWETGPNQGQVRIINRGFKLASGQILAFISSDDYYLPNAFFKVADEFIQHNYIDLLYGKCWYIDKIGIIIEEHFGNISSINEMLNVWDFWWSNKLFVQPEVFFTKRICDKIGLFREDLDIIFDYEYWLRILKSGGIFGRLDEDLACFRISQTQKSMNKERASEEFLVLLQYWLWDTTVRLSFRKRIELQGRWLYQVKFLKQIGELSKTNENKLLRWSKSFIVVLFHPKIILDPKFKDRIRRWLIRIFLFSNY